MSAVEHRLVGALTWQPSQHSPQLAGVSNQLKLLMLYRS